MASLLVARQRCSAARPAGASQRALAAPRGPVDPARTRLRPLRVHRDDDHFADASAGNEELDLFTAETTKVVMRSLTARAVQKVLIQLGPVDGYSAKWLNSYCSKHPPLQGNDFVARLMAERPFSAMDPYDGTTHHVVPQELANRVLAIRADLAQRVAGALPGRMQRENWAVLRQHLEQHTYVSGTHLPKDAARPSYRARRASSRNNTGNARGSQAAQ